MIRLHERLLTYCGAFCVLCLILSSSAEAFHEKGVAACNSCHFGHNSQDGFPIYDGGSPGPGPGPTGATPLLLAETPSELCLSCHGEVIGFDPLAPPPERGAGNFVFLLEDNLNDSVDGLMNPIPGDAAGHNINAPSHGIYSDGTYVLSPGGHFPAQQLECTSCHDPHGNTNFRMLWGVGIDPSRPIVFTFPAPEAEGLDIMQEVESDNLHTAYRSGISDWCGNCHGQYHSEMGGSPFEHPAEHNLETSISSFYGSYNGSTDPFGGDPATSYLAAVPYEDATMTTTTTAGPSSTSRVMCLSCHRAHASSSPRSGRWDFKVDYLDNDGAISGSWPIPNPFPGDPAQQQLCQKCHADGIPD